MTLPNAATRGIATTILILAGAPGCTKPGLTAPTNRYIPQARQITVTTVPMLVREDQTIYPFLKPDFGKGGVLEGKEVYAFSPSMLTAIEGDTIHFTFVNPEDDVHSFVLPDFAVALPGQKTTTATYVARHAGIYTILCNIPAHLPMMSGQLIVLAPGAIGSAKDSAAPAAAPRQ